MQIILMWVGRRVLELGGIAGALLTAWSALPPATQNAVLALLTSKWDTVTLGALAPIAVSLFGYVWSFRATVKPQVVVDGKKVAVEALPPAAKAAVKEAAAAAPKRKTLLDIFR